MKLIDYIHYLQYLHIKHGDDIEVCVKVKDTKEKCTPVFRPRYNKEFHCIVLHEFYVTHDY